MDTIYYTANFRTVKVAGGEDQVRVYLVPETGAKGKSQGHGASRMPRPTKGNGEIVSLAVARARVERKNAWKALVDAAWG